MRLDYGRIEHLLIAALSEDIGSGDITSKTIVPKETMAIAKIRSKESGIVCGTDIIPFIFRILGKKVIVKIKKRDGQKVKKGEFIAEISGNARTILTVERTILNFMKMMSGTATISYRYSEKIKDLPTKVLDTRKTHPCMRYLQKYAVKCGGAENHRKGLYDMVLIKDNHIAVNGSISHAVARARKKVGKGCKIEVECSNLKQIREALETDCDWIMLDNMNLADMKKAVKMIGGKKKIEASGGITIKNIRDIAKTGVDYISCGALTHSYKALDLSMGTKLLR